MELTSYTALDLYERIRNNRDKEPDFLLLDVRNPTEFGRFKVEGPGPVDMVNVPYMEFVEFEDQSVVKVPKGKPVRVVCAKEGSAKYVGEILVNNGFEDVAYLEGGIKSWGNLLVPVLVADNSGYQLFQFIRPGKASCSYGLVSGKEMMLFDPSRNTDFYLNFAKGKGARIIRTCETHLQADYIAGSNQIAELTGAVFSAPELDFKDAVYEHVPVKDQDVFSFKSGGPEIKALHTPGHTPGSTCYLIDNAYLVSGDTVFIASVGRPDLGGKAVAWAKLLYATLKEKISALPGDTVVMPGHFIEWSEADSELRFIDTLESVYEKNKAIYAIGTEEAFIKFIQDNMRDQPPEYARIRQVNAGVVTVDADEQETLDLGKNECAASAG